MACNYCPGCAIRGGCWYNRAQWKKTAKAVLRRDMHRCYVRGCPSPGIAADHVEPVHPAISWFDFLSMANLRASCRRHNTARGVAQRLEREVRDGVPEVTSEG